MARVVTVYSPWREVFRPVEMGYIRWLKISEALARRGHQVDLATNETLPESQGFPVEMGKNLRRVSLDGVRWADYDVVKTLFDVGFDTLEAYGGTRHPFIISKLGSVVGPEDREGIYFHGDVREQMYATQEKIQRTSAYVTLLTEPALRLWEECFGRSANLLLVPGAAEREVPPPTRDPFPRDGWKRCIFAGNIYVKHAQPDANATLTRKLNRLGRLLAESGIRLYLLGYGDVSGIDGRYVTYLGTAPYDEAWDYLHFADVGAVVAAGSFMHNNESTKIYHYLRVGLPVVSEAGFPNDHVVRESQLGFVVQNGDLELMARRIDEAASTDWDRDLAIRHILAHHTWDRRVEVYESLLRRHFGPGRGGAELGAGAEGSAQEAGPEPR
jgi:glycosyltransferase involved in cell wall biosynthesis